jgi:nucleoside-diphosphate-sugar epimerase
MSGRVLVTGATGHLGANLLRRLLADGEAVRVLLQPGVGTQAVDGLDVERVEADLRDASAVERALRGCESAYHCAAIVSTVDGNAAHRSAIFQTNVVGTKHVLDAASKAGVRRVVVSGSFSAVGYDPSDPTKPANEDMVADPFVAPMPYSISKIGCEHECWKAAARGLEVVVAVSCAIIGPNDFTPSRLGGTLCAFAAGKIHAYIPGGFPWVAARDIADGHVRAMHRGRSGERYIIASEYKSMDELMDIFARVTGRPRPHLRLPPGVMYGIATLAKPFVTRFVPPARHRLTQGAIRVLTLHRRADITKAETELGFSPTPIAEAVQDAYDWFCEMGRIASNARPRPQGAARSEPAPAPVPLDDDRRSLDA